MTEKVVSQKSLMLALEELYDVGCLSESKQKLYYLISRYEDKVSLRLKKVKEALRLEGEKEFGDLIRKTLLRPNPFLKLLEDSEFKGLYVPVVYGETK